MAMREATDLPTGTAKERFVRRLFGDIAPTYDIMNIVLSGGFIHLWHRAFQRHTGLGPGHTARTSAPAQATSPPSWLGRCGRMGA